MRETLVHRKLSAPAGAFHDASNVVISDPKKLEGITATTDEEYVSDCF